MAKKTILVLISIVMLIFAGCTIEENLNNNKDNNTQIVNPASVFCKQSGGTLEIREDKNGGQSGVCMFNDGSECEEWAFQRGECKKGESNNYSNNTSQNNKEYSFNECKNNGGTLMGISLNQCEFNGKIYIKDSNKIIDLKQCYSYFDGCNNCMISNNEISGCTKMYCQQEEEPECRINEVDEKENLCTSKDGTYDKEFKECLGIDKGTCEQIGGEFDECASACRHTPDAQICTMQCAIICDMS